MSGISGPKPAHFAAMHGLPHLYSALMLLPHPSSPCTRRTAPAPHGLRPWLAACWVAGSVGMAHAAAPALPAGWGLPGAADAAVARQADDPITAELEDTLRTQLQQVALASSQQALPGVSRVEIQVGRLDPRLRLAPCQRVEPYLPTGTRLWGKARIGLRCAQGATPWNVYLPITVKVFGPAWVAAATLAAGAELGPGDLVQAEVDWAEDSTPVVSDPAQAVGRVLQRRITAGQSVRTADLRPRQWFNAGAVVKLVAIGPGYTITGSGEALSHGIEGQPVRVRTEGGRVVVGQAAGDRRVEVRP